MKESLRVLEEERVRLLAESKKYRNISIPFFVLGVLGFILGSFIYELNGIGFFIGFVFLIIGIIIASLSGAKTKPFKEKFKSEIVKILFQDNYDDVKYSSKYHADIKEFLSTGLVSHPDRWRSEDHVEAKYKNVSFSVDEFTLERRHVTRDSKGNTRVTYVTYFHGRLFKFNFNKKFKDQLRIVEKTFAGFDMAPKGFEKVETESLAFNKKFKIQATTKEHAFYIITSTMLEEILRIESLFGGSISLLYRDNSLYIAVNDNKNTLEPRLNIPLTDEGLKYYLYDILIMSEIINGLDLDKRKFNENLS